MRNVLPYMSMSLDGYVASEREHPGAAVAEDAELTMSSLWPRSTDAYAAPMNEIPRVVFSRTPDADATWPTTRVARCDSRVGSEA